MLTTSQQLAHTVLEHVQTAAAENKTYKQKYGTMSHKLPVLVRTAGLVQALAFVEARGEQPHHQLLADLAETLGYNSRDELLQRSRVAELEEYMYVTQRVLTAMLWYKRFAQSVLGVEAGDEEDQAKEATADASKT